MRAKLESVLLVLAVNAFGMAIAHAGVIDVTPAEANPIASPEQRVSITHAIFTRDYSNPKLEEAYRDPSDHIWGSPFKDRDEKQSSVLLVRAFRSCRDAVSHVPRKPEFEQLAKFLGKDSPLGYSPNSVDGKAILPGLSNDMIWTSSVNFLLSDRLYVFNGLTGELHYAQVLLDDLEAATLCVSGP